MNKAYKRINWENSPSTASPLNETNLNKMDYALDAVDTRVTEIYNQKDAMATATTAANEAADNANAAAVSANTAAANANEAAQAVLDEKYILTATTEMVKSGSASPTARGNALLEKLVGSSWQRTLTGKNKINVGTITFTLYKSFTGLSIPPGTYTLSVDSVVSSDTDDSVSSVYIYNGDDTTVQLHRLDFARSNNRQSFTFTTTKEINTISFYSAMLYGTSKDDTATFTNVQLEAGSTVTDYEPYCGNTPSPNPSYKQDIRSVGDMGWFDGEWVTGCYINNSGGTSIGTQCAICKNDIPCKENDVVLVEYDGELNHTAQSVTIAFYDSTGAMLKRFASGNTDSSLSATAPANSAYFRFDLRNGNGTNGVVDTTVKTKVTVNDVEYVAILESVRTNELSSKRFAVNRAGDVTYTFYEDGRIGVNGTSTGGTSYVTLAATLDKGKYILTGNPTGTSTQQYITLEGDNAVDNGEGAIFEVTERKTYRVRTARLTSGESADNVIVSPMIRKLDSEGNPIGSDTYVPHESKRIYIPISEPLRAIGDVKDEIVVRDGKYGVLRRIKHYEFNGSEGWTDRTDAYTKATEGQRRYYLSTLERYYHTTQTPAMSNIGVYVRPDNGITGVDTYAPAGMLLYYNPNISSGGDGTSGSLYLTTENTEIIDKTTFVNWISANPVTLDYELATPVFEPFPDQTPFYGLQSYDEVTHVSIAGLHENLEPTFAMRFPRHEDGALVTTAYCKSKKAEIRMDELTAAMLALSQE